MRRLTIAIALILIAAPAVQADFDQAMTYFKAGKYLEAAGEFQTLVDQSPDYADGYHLLGICFLQVSKFKEAETNLAKAIELNGDKFEYHYNLARAYQLQKRHRQVVTTLNTAEDLAADDRQKLGLYKVRGYALAAQKQWSDAIEDLEKAREISADAATLTQLGKAYFSLGYNDKAAQRLGEAVKLVPNHADSNLLLAKSLLLLGAEAKSDTEKKKKYGEALAVAERYAKLEPSSVEAKYLVGRAALGARDFPKATASFSEVVAAEPGHCNAMTNLGKTYIAQKKWDDALGALTKATSCDSKMSVAWENRGFVLQKMKRYPDAVDSYNKAQEIKPSASIAKAIADCQTNMDVIAHNEEMERQRKEQEEEIERAEKEYEEQQKKVDSWKEKQQGD